MAITLQDLERHPVLLHEVLGKYAAKNCYEKHISQGKGTLLSSTIGFYKKDNSDHYQDIARGFLAKMNEYVASGLVITEQVGDDTGFLPAIFQDSELDPNNIN